MTRTIGPWHYEDPGERFAYVSSKDASVYNGGDVATFWGDDAHAHARLAAAAPDLLAALRALVNAVCDAGLHSSQFPAAEREAAETAIAKATQ